MRALMRPLALVPLAMLALAIVWPAMTAAQGATATVTIYDNNARPPSQGVDAAQGVWGYAPHHVQVQRGEPVLFNNPASNSFPHTVTSITRTGTPFEAGLAAGARFDSSPSQDALVRPGNAWTLDTSGMDAGHYAYYCRIHLWMVGSVSVLQ